MAEPLRSGRVFSAPHVAGYWAKARAAIDGGPVWHPLAYHCPDVAAAADRLLANSPRRLEPLAGLAQTSPAALHGLFVLLIALHDIGKFSRRFQPRATRRGKPSGTVAAMPIQMLAMTRSGSPCGTRSSRSSSVLRRAPRGRPGSVGGYHRASRPSGRQRRRGLTLASRVSSLREGGPPRVGQRYGRLISRTIGYSLRLHPGQPSVKLPQIS